MSGDENSLRGYLVSVAAVQGSPGAYHVSYVPRGPQQERGVGGRPKRVPEFKARVQASGDAPVAWDRPPAEQQEMMGRFNDDARKRVMSLNVWLEHLNDLIGSARTWANDLGWATKIVEKPMEDSEIGRYTAPALLLQENTIRLLLEPISRTAPRAEGVVDLYRMPAYEDIASLYYYENRWNIHYMAEGQVVTTMREGASKPLSKASFAKVLKEMTSHAE